MIFCTVRLVLEFKLPVVVESGGQRQDAEWEIIHCPGNAGCRAQLVAAPGLPTGSREFYLDGDFTLNVMVCLTLPILFLCCSLLALPSPLIYKYIGTYFHCHQ